MPVTLMVSTHTVMTRRWAHTQEPLEGYRHFQAEGGMFVPSPLSAFERESTMARSQGTGLCGHKVVHDYYTRGNPRPKH